MFACLFELLISLFLDWFIDLFIFLIISFLGKLKHPKPLSKFLHHHLVAYRMTTILVGPANSWCDFPLIRWAKGSKRDGLKWPKWRRTSSSYGGWMNSGSFPKKKMSLESCAGTLDMYIHIYIYISWLLRNPAANQLSLGIDIFTVDHG